MTSSDERRELAHRLREHSGAKLFTGDDVERLIGAEPSGFRPKDADTNYNLLADLIDRPTCHDVSDFDNEAFKCSRCGHRVLSLGGDICDAVVVSPDGLISEYYYCPNCGAEVVE